MQSIFSDSFDIEYTPLDKLRYIKCLYPDSKAFIISENGVPPTQKLKTYSSEHTINNDIDGFDREFLKILERNANIVTLDSYIPEDFIDVLNNGISKLFLLEHSDICEYELQNINVYYNANTEVINGIIESNSIVLGDYEVIKDGIKLVKCELIKPNEVFIVVKSPRSLQVKVDGDRYAIISHPTSKDNSKNSRIIKVITN